MFEQFQRVLEARVQIQSQTPAMPLHIEAPHGQELVSRLGGERTSLNRMLNVAFAIKRDDSGRVYAVGDQERNPSMNTLCLTYESNTTTIKSITIGGMHRVDKLEDGTYVLTSKPAGFYAPMQIDSLALDQTSGKLTMLAGDNNVIEINPDGTLTVNGWATYRSCGFPIKRH